MPADEVVPPRFHIIIVLAPHNEWIHGCLAAALAQSLPPAQISIVEDAVAPAEADRIAEAFPSLQRIRHPEPLGFAAAINRAAARVRDAEFLLLLSPDGVLALDALEQLGMALRAHPNAGLMGCKVLAGDVETIQHVGSEMMGNAMPRDLGRGEVDSGQYGGVREVLGVQVAAVAVRPEIWCELGGLDESFWPSYFEIADYCFRLRAAHWRVGVACDATVTHFENAPPHGLRPEQRPLFFANRARFLRKHYRGKRWWNRYLPDELRWLVRAESRGMRLIAVRTMLAALVRPRSSRPQTVQQADPW